MALLGVTSASEAAPMTWHYTGTVAGSSSLFFPTFPDIPIGTPASFTVTVDPAANQVRSWSTPCSSVGFGPGCEDWLGQYYFDIRLDVLGATYQNLGSVIEVNADIAHTWLMPGGVIIRYSYAWSGPNALPIRPLAIYAGEVADPESSALLMPFPRFEVLVPVYNEEELFYLRVVGTNPVRVPEPGVVLLMTCGLLCALSRRSRTP
jgi:hypothetical protein